MTQPVQHLGHTAKGWALWQRRPRHHDHPQTQGPGGGQLGLGTAAAGVLGHNDVDPVTLQEGEIACDVKRTARDHRGAVWQQGRGGRVDQAQQVMVLRRGGKDIDILPAYRQKNAGGHVGQGLRGIVKALHLGPTRLNRPGWTQQRYEGHVQGVAGGGNVVADLRGKRVGGVNHMGDLFIAQPGGQAKDATKAADALRQGLGEGRGGSTGIGKHRVDPGLGKRLSHEARLGGAAEQKDAGHG